MDYWARAPMAREQIALFSPTLDAMIGEDHPVRLFDEILTGCDWAEWEGEYHGKLGQPPIHPRIVAGAILYGLSRGIRSSRHLEYLIEHNIDFMWLVEGRTIDHSTICEFRRRFGKPLKNLFRQLGRIAMTMGLIRLNEVALDGTQVKANNGRHETLTASTIDDRLIELDKQIDSMLQEAEAADTAEQRAFSVGESSHKLPKELADLKRRQKELQDALVKVRAAEEIRRGQGRDPKDNPAQIPSTDPDSKVLPNKEGGYAPNYTPMAATDVHRGFIVDADVVNDTVEHTVTVPAVDRIEESFGQKPETVMADAAHATGPNMAEMEQREVEFLSPVESKAPEEGNPAKREDATQPVPESQWPDIPRNPSTKKLDKSAFVYDASSDVYYCPMGKPLKHAKTKPERRRGGQVRVRVYQCSSCAGCPLMDDCWTKTVKHGRTVSRDEHEAIRERHVEMMRTDRAKVIYAKRFHAAETPFAVIKASMNVRQFLLRGLEHVTTEWFWTCTAFNLKKLIREVARLRAEFARCAAMAEG